MPFLLLIPSILVCLLLFSPSKATFAPQIPSLASFSPSPGGPFVLTADVQVVVNPQYADTGAPSLLEFAQTFRADLLELTGFSALPSVTTSSALSGQSSIYLTLGATNYTLYNGQPTAEAYELSVTREGITIRGSGALGAWWGTRTLLQQIALSSSGGPITIPAGSGWDAPGWDVRGFMLDAGRHWFEPAFLSDLCTYASFFKLNEFHIHASDNLWDPTWLYTDLWPDLYAGFRFRPATGSANTGVVPRLNESWSQADWQGMQASCAARGVALVPEIDTPGHSLAISQWRPELMLAGNPDQLNLSYPETIPVIKGLWAEFLPWFSAREVSIGADEYPSEYAEEYIAFVNEMSDYIYSQSGKSIRAWGTYEPSTTLSIAKNVTIQHWDFPADTIPVQLLAAGYSVINSEQAFLYLDGKFSDGGEFPQSLNEQLLWAGAPGGQGWAPNIFSATDAGNNTTPDAAGLRGAVFALWEDWGNNATDPWEVYLQLARSVAVFAEKSWAGSGVRGTQLSPGEFNASYPVLNAAAPGQNLNRAVKSAPGNGNIVWSYDLSTHDFASAGPVSTPYPSVGPPYTLTFTVSPRSSNGTLFSGMDTALRVSSLTFVDVPTNEFYVPLPAYALPLDVRTTVEIHATREYTYAVITQPGAGGEGGETTTVWWTTLMDIWGEYMERANMSFPAPAGTIGGDGFEGAFGRVELVLGA